MPRVARALEVAAGESSPPSSSAKTSRRMVGQATPLGRAQGSHRRPQRPPGTPRAEAAGRGIAVGGGLAGLC